MRCQRSSLPSVRWPWQKISRCKTGWSRFGPSTRPGSFQAILYNLLSNAVKFTPRAGRIDIDCHGDGNVVCISVTDTASVSEPRIRRHLRRIPAGRGCRCHDSRRYGLGLAITKRLVEQQGVGFRWKASLEKVADYFYSSHRTQNVARPSPVAESSNASSRLSAGRTKPLILVVDDEIAARSFLPVTWIQNIDRHGWIGSEAVKRAQQLHRMRSRWTYSCRRQWLRHASRPSKCACDGAHSDHYRFDCGPKTGGLCIGCGRLPHQADSQTGAFGYDSQARPAAATTMMPLFCWSTTTPNPGAVGGDLRSADTRLRACKAERGFRSALFKTSKCGLA